MSLRYALVAIGCVAGCGAPEAFGGLSTSFPDNRPDDLRRALADVGTSTRTDRACVVGATAEGAFAFDIENGVMLWRKAANLRGVPFAAGDYVATQERHGTEGVVLLRRLDTGDEVYSLPDEELHLIGADGEGDLVALVLSVGGGVGSQSHLVVLRGGNVLWELTAPQPFGRPSVLAGRVFLPWGHQNLSIFDGDGSELARVRLDTVLGSTRVQAGRVFVGESEAYRVDDALATGLADQANALHYFAVDLPGSPPFFGRSYFPPPPPESATHRIRLEWSARAADGSMEMDRGQLYFVFYRAVFGLEARSMAMRWAKSLASDVVGAEALTDGLLVATEEGRISFLGHAAGEPVDVATLGVRPAAVRFRAGAWAPRHSGTHGDERSIDAQLLTIAEHVDARLVPVQRLAVDALASHPEAEATAHLVTLCDTAPIEQTRQAACEALSSRTVGPDAVLEALQRHGRFLEDTRPPPVGPLAHAAAHLQEERAVPLLIQHLEDPATPTGDLPWLLKALGALGDRETASPIRAFLRLYHADAAGLEEALRAAIDALVGLEGGDAESVLSDLLEDPLTDPLVRDHARTALAALQPPPDEAEEASEDDDAPTVPEDAIPEHLTSDIVSEALRPVAARLRRCLAEVDGFPRSARLILVFDGRSHLETLSVLPAAAEPCITPLVRSQRFPETRTRQRQQVNYTFRR